jgi:predicted esterase
MPAAGLAPSPTLPVPAGWPFPDAFPRTMGSGRLVGGALEWTDFIFDDHGADNGPRLNPATIGTPAGGSYTYPAGAAAGNGADIFRVGVGDDGAATYWRVDWNTLIGPAVPIAEFALDTDDNQKTGVAAWPAGAGVTSPGIDRALLVSSRGAWLIDGPSGRRTAIAVVGGSLSVDPIARSFVARIPVAALRPSGTWRIRLASGLANPAGNGFQPVGLDHGALPGQPAVYNVAFRTSAQEAPNPPMAPGATSLVVRANYWNDKAQGAALATGDVSAFSTGVDWSRLRARSTTPELLPTGYSDQWYVSSTDAGGSGLAPDSNTTTSVQPVFLGRVQPFGVYVPTTYRPDRPTPLTWILHSLTQNHNQYGVLSPNFLRQACEDRGSICATTLGRGPDEWYQNQSRLDFFEVWHRLATTYDLDPERTVLSGYSMGGYAAYELGLTYPDLFAEAVSLAGPPVCGIDTGIPGISFPPGFPSDPGPAKCGADGDTRPLVANARWLPYVIADGAEDELVPVTGTAEQVQRFAALGLRYQWFLYSFSEHNSWAAEDQFGPEAAAMRGPDGAAAPSVVNDPGRISYAWFPDAASGGFETTAPSTMYWLSGLTARRAGPGVLATIDATSHAHPDPAVTVRQTQAPLLTTEPDPGVLTTQSWLSGSRPPRRPEVDLHLTDVAAITLSASGAGLHPGERSIITVATDGPLNLTVTGLDGGAPLVFAVPAGRHLLAVG